MTDQHKADAALLTPDEVALVVRLSGYGPQESGEVREKVARLTPAKVAALRVLIGFAVEKEAAAKRAAAEFHQVRPGICKHLGAPNGPMIGKREYP